MPPKNATAAKAKPRGIKSGDVLPTEEFKQQMGWGQKAWVAARKRGLPTRKISKRLYVVTDEAIAWMKSQGAAT